MADELQDALAETYEAPPVGSEEAEQWRITSDGMASWAARKVRQARAEIDRLTAQADEERARIEDWLNDRTYGLRRQVEFFTEHLSGYYSQLHADNPDLPKTYPVLGAKLGRRKNPDRVEVTDEEAFISWAMANGRRDLLNVSPAKKALRSLDWLITEEGREFAVTEEGEKVPGVVWVVGEERYTVEVDP